MKQKLQKLKGNALDSLLPQKWLLSLLTLLFAFGAGTSDAWAQKSWTAAAASDVQCVATLTGQTTFSAQNTNVELNKIGSETKVFDGKTYYKLSNDDSYVKLTRSDGGKFQIGDELSVMVGNASNENTRNLGFRLNNQANAAVVESVEKDGFVKLVYTLKAEDISADGSVIIGRAGDSWECRYYQFEVKCSSLVGGVSILDNDLVTVKLGANSGSWTYNTSRNGITNNMRGDDISNSGYIEVTPKKKIEFKLSTYSSQGNCNLIMYDSADPENILVDYRQKDYHYDQFFGVKDFDVLYEGHTYIIYGKSFKSSGALDYIFFKDITVTAADQNHIVYTGENIGTGSDAFGTTFSRFFTLGNKQQYQFSFKLEGGEHESWENWYLYASKTKTHNGDVSDWVANNELLWLRADGYGASEIHLYKNNMANELTCADNSGLHDASFVEGMKNATVDMTVTYADNRLFVYAQIMTSTSDMYYLTGVKNVENSGNPVELFFGVENSKILELEAIKKENVYKQTVSYDSKGNSQGTFDIQSVNDIVYPYYTSGTNKITYISEGESIKIYATPNAGNILEAIGYAKASPRTWTQNDTDDHTFWVLFNPNRGPKITFSAPDVFGAALPAEVLVSAKNLTKGTTISSGDYVDDGDEIEIVYKQYSFNAAQALVPESRLVLYNWKINGEEDHINIPSSGIVWNNVTSSYKFIATHDMDIQAIYNLSYVMNYPNNSDPTLNTITGGTFDVHAYDPGDNNERLGHWSGMKAGTNVTLEATPSSGYIFDHWIGKLLNGSGEEVWHDDNWSTSPTFVFNIDLDNTFDNSYGYDIYVEPVFRVAVPYLSETARIVDGTNPGTIDLKSFVKESTDKTITYDITYAKDATSELTASVDNGILSFDQKGDINKNGGAVIVEVKVDGTSIGNYVATVPYIGKHTWDFHTMENKEGHKTSGEFKLEYEVVENGVHKDPMTVYQSPVHGDNAAVIDATNGLYIDNGNKRNLGLSAIGPDGRTTTPQDISAVTDVWLVTLKNSTLTIPQVKKDWFIRMYLLPHAGGTQGSGAGTEFTVENLKDLNGQVIDPTHTIVTNGVKRPVGGDVISYVHNQNRIDGCLIFRVNEPGDVKFNFSNNGWDKIVKIVVDNTYRTEFELGSDGGGKNVDFKRYNHSWVYREYDPSYGKPNTAPYIYYNGDPNVKAENAKLINHTINKYTEERTGNQIQGSLAGVTAEESEWNSKGATYRGVTVRGNSGVGNVKIISNAIYDGKVRTDGWQNVARYVLNTNETWVAVGKLKVQKYPYTWDFTSYNMDASTDKTTDKIAINSAAIGVADQPADTLYGSWNGSAHNRTVQVPGTPDETSPYYTVDDDGNKTYNVMIWKPLFADGSQLTVGNETIRETEGLGISIGQAPLDGKGNLRAEQVSLTGSVLAVNGETSMTMTIPEVPASMYIFVKCSNEPSSVSNAVAVDEFELKDGVHCYKPSTDGDVKITFPQNTSIERIGVTDQIKEIKYYGWATESRAYNIDHKETGKFSTDTKIYKLADKSGWKENGKYSVSSAQADMITGDVYVPAGTGILMSIDADWSAAAGLPSTAPANTRVPLFVPAVNIPEPTDDFAGNLLIPTTTGDGKGNASQTSFSISPKKVYETGSYYVLSNYCYRVDKDNKLLSNNKIVTVPSFYRYIGSGATMTNKAYLLMDAAESLPISNSTKLFSFGAYLDEDAADATAIDGVFAEEDIIDNENDVYYNVSGQLLDGKPSMRGVYIKNGKKFYNK